MQERKTTIAAQKRTFLKKAAVPKDVATNELRVQRKGEGSG